MRVGVFGGSFDPIHLGHLLLAEQCLGSAKLDQVLFIPAFVPPHKQDWQLTRSEDRIQMIRLAISGNERFQLETCELDRSGISYTVDTLNHLIAQRPDHQWFLLMGADSLDEFHTWKDPEQICKLATPIVVNRPGSPPVDYRKFLPFADEAKVAEIESIGFNSRQIEISSTEIREIVSQNNSIRYQTPRAVEQYILEKGLYRNG